MPDILIDHFYKINSLTRNDNTISAQVTFNAAHAIFGGHFPDMPVVPGVCQTQMLGEILSKAFNKDFSLKTASSIKFLSVIDPVVQSSINIAVTATLSAGNQYTVTAQYSSEAKIFFKLKGVYTTAG